MVGDGKAEQRCSKRLKVFQPARLAGPDAEARIHLLDVSATGALAHAAETAPAAGAALYLECSGIRAAVTVRWSRGQRFGLHFDVPLDPDQLRRITKAGASLEARVPLPAR